MEQKRKAIGVAMALAGAELFHLTGSSSSSSEEEGEEATARIDNFTEVVRSMSDDYYCKELPPHHFCKGEKTTAVNRRRLTIPLRLRN